MLTLEYLPLNTFKRSPQIIYFFPQTCYMFKTQLNPEYAGFFAALSTLFVLGQPGSHWCGG